MCPVSQSLSGVLYTSPCTLDVQATVEVCEGCHQNDVRGVGACRAR